MKTYSVYYVGQLRFYECMSTHKDMLADASNVYCCVTPSIKEVWNTAYKATNCIDPIPLDKVYENILTNAWVKEIKILSDKDYSWIDDPHSIKFWPCNYFFTLAQSLKEDNSDFSVFITTDLLFSKESNLRDMINNYNTTDVPILYCDNIDNDDHLIKTQVICINRAAKDLVKKNWKDAIQKVLDEDHPYILRNEYITLRLMQLCGIATTVRLEINNNIIRFRPNMSLSNLSYDSLNLLSAEYSREKRDFITARNKKKAKKNI